MITAEQIASEAERYRAAVTVISRVDGQSLAGTLFASAFAAVVVQAARTHTRFSKVLRDELAADRLLNRAGAECGLEGGVMLQEWICDNWQYITDYSEDVVVPVPLTAEEARVHRATVELFLDANPQDRTAVVAYAAALAVSVVRCGGAPAGSPKGREAAEWLAADPIAAMAVKELDGDETSSIAMSVGFEWREIQARADTIATMAAIEAAA